MELLTPGIGLIFWQTVIFLMLVGILSAFVWRPISDALRSREQFIADSLKAAELAKLEIEELKEDNADLIREARLEKDALLKEATHVANKIKDDARAETSKITDKMVAAAKATIETEKKAALTEIKNEVAMLSLAIAEKVIKKNLESDKSQKDLVQQFIKDLKTN
ncbi:MAG: F0F1 ATP synthase subunit B [Bacteroidetes bacterium]|nr:F0F1 ATP synthase subunit B [Bacteroidota bacterium]MDA1118946.1 F0F1 ATP synthase subunit B [Bacteroidota bacterium]